VSSLVSWSLSNNIGCARSRICPFWPNLQYEFDSELRSKQERQYMDLIDGRRRNLSRDRALRQQRTDEYYEPGRHNECIDIELLTSN